MRILNNCGHTLDITVANESSATVWTIKDLSSGGGQTKSLTDDESELFTVYATPSTCGIPRNFAINYISTTHTTTNNSTVDIVQIKSQFLSNVSPGT